MQCTPVPLESALLLALTALLSTTPQGDDVFPIPGTKRVKYLEQNAEAYHISKTLTKEELAELEAAVPKHEVRPVS